MRRRSAGWSGPLGLYRPGSSPLHRAPAGAKLVALAAVSTLVVLTRGWPAAVGALVAVLVVAWLAHVPPRLGTPGSSGVLVTVALVGGYQAWAVGPAAGVEAGAELLTLVVAGTLLTATTRPDALLDAVAGAARPVTWFGASPERVALAVGLVVRSVPVLGRAVAESRDAARARGLDRDPRAVVVPAAVRAVGHARRTGEALAARGLGDA